MHNKVGGGSWRHAEPNNVTFHASVEGTRLSTPLRLMFAAGVSDTHPEQVGLTPTPTYLQGETERERERERVLTEEEQNGKEITQRNNRRESGDVVTAVFSPGLDLEPSQYF